MRDDLKTLGHTKFTALKLVREHAKPGGSVLELSCGAGILAGAMARAGFSVRGTNYSVYPGLSPGVGTDIPVDTGVDLTRPLPYPDASFDCVVLSEVLQNIPDHPAVLREVARVLKPGGVFVLTTPNMMSIKSRLHFLFTGYFKVKWMFPGHDVPLSQSFAFHNHPVHLPVLLYYLAALGFREPVVDGIYVKAKSVALFLALAGLIKPLTWLNVTRGEKNLKRSGASAQHYRALTGRKALSADRLAVVARKGQTSDQATGQAQAQGVSGLPDWIRKFDE